MEYTERGGLDAGFSKVFHERVRRPLMALDAERLRRRNAALSWSIGAIALGLAIAVPLLWGFPDSSAAFFIAILAAILAAAVALGAWGLHSSAWTGAVAETVMPAVTDHVGQVSYDKEAGAGFPLGAVRHLGLVGPYDDTSLSDRLEGQHQGTGFVLVEAKLTKAKRKADGKKHTTTVFKGLLFQIDVPITAPGKILIARDRGALGNSVSGLFQGDRGRGLPRVAFDHNDFERMFEVHAEDPEGARAFMPPGFLNTLLQIARREGGGTSKPMVAGFDGDAFYLALYRKRDFLRMGGLTTPVATMEAELHAIFDDIEVVHRIIDRLHGR